MKKILAMAVVFGFAMLLGAGEPQKQKAPAFNEFVKVVPQFGDMDKGKAETKRTGKPTICWVSETGNPSDIFKDETFRQLSFDLKDTTVQVNMTRNPGKDRFDAKGRPLGMRLEFSANGYDDDAPVAYVTKDKIGPDTARKVLEFVRGGK
jgi:hypothetical protein